MITSWFHDVEVLPNFFSITFIDLKDYLDKCKNNDAKGKPIPLTDTKTRAEIDAILDSVKNKSFYITDEDDSQLLSLVAFLNEMRAKRKLSINAAGEEVTTYDYTDVYSFNGKSYDDLMVAAFLMYFDKFDSTKLLIKRLMEISGKIIAAQDRDNHVRDQIVELLFKFKLPYRSVDVMKIFALDKIFKSLKQTSINLKWHELLEWDIPPIDEEERIKYYASDPIYRGYSVDELNKYIDRWHRHIHPKYIPTMMYYNKNDCFIGCEIVRQKIEDIRLRYSSSAKYGINFLCSSRSNMADKLLVKYYSKLTGLQYKDFKDLKTNRTLISFKKVVFDYIKFKTPELQSFLEEVKNTKIYHTTKDEFCKTINFHGATYTIAAGGIHSVDPPRALISSPEVPNGFKYIHWDISSFYPSIMIENGICPAHINKSVFISLLKEWRDTRVTAKHAGDKITAETLKIVINAIYGKLGYELGFLCDRLAQMQVTINGQLMIMMLIEELALAGIQCFSANTDGIVIKLYNKDVNKFNTIADNWCKYTHLGADSEEYERYVNRDINCYMIRETNGKVSYKGSMNPKMYIVDLQKGYNMPIVATAISEYLLNSTPVMDTLTRATNILDFCKTQNVNSSYQLQFTFVDKGVVNHNVMQKNSRFYISNSGGILEKVRPSTKIEGKEDRNRLTVGHYCTMLNSFDDKPIDERNIDYSYYYNEAMKIINPIMLNGIAKSKIKVKKSFGMYNSLFDLEDE